MSTTKLKSIAKALREGFIFGPRSHCAACHEVNDERDDIDRGICAACWQVVELLQTAEAES